MATAASGTSFRERPNSRSKLYWLDIDVTFDDITRQQQLNKEGYWYLASVYSKWAPRLDEACDLVSRLAGKFTTAGVPVFSPIAHSHTIAMAAGIDPLSHEIWMPADKPMVDNAVGMIVAKMEKWWTSKGIAQEIIWFTEHGKPIWYLNLEDLQLKQGN